MKILTNYSLGNSTAQLAFVKTRAGKQYQPHTINEITSLMEELGTEDNELSGDKVLFNKEE